LKPQLETGVMIRSPVPQQALAFQAAIGSTASRFKKRLRRF
jgi:hypothetical protein